MESEATLRWERREVGSLTTAEQAALHGLSSAVYPPDAHGNWPGHVIEWERPQRCIIGWSAGNEALCHVGIILREALWSERPVKVGGIGGVKTHPGWRRRGFVRHAIQKALAFFQEQKVDFGLLVCEPHLVPFYERLGWQRFPGNLMVTQKQATVSFTFNLPMTIPLSLHEPLDGTIDLLGPPW